jgi:hypothetical protein
VSEARPSHCPGCGTASRPAGGHLVLHGHGVRERQCWGPEEIGASAKADAIKARRYRCRSCRTVIIVVPGEIAFRRRYTASVIALAMALYGVARESAASIRAKLCPWRILGAAATGWVTLGRWVKAVGEGRMWRCVRPCPSSFSSRQVAERGATAVATYWPAPSPSLALESAAFLGAIRAR